MQCGGLEIVEIVGRLATLACPCVRQRLPTSPAPYLQFRYRVIRVWELPAVIERMKARLDAEPDPATVAELWTATKGLLGLRYRAEFVEQLLQGIRVMKESTTY